MIPESQYRNGGVLPNACRSILFQALICSTFLLRAWSQPFNDDFANREILSGFPAVTAGSNIGATAEPGDPSEVSDTGAGTVWWEWTAPSFGRVTVSTAGSAIDTLLAVYTGTESLDLAVVASNDDEDVLAGIFTSSLNFFAQAGTRYWIVVTGLKQDAGTFDAGDIRLSISPSPAKPAPAWAATDVNGKPIQSSDFAGKIVLLDFWATWCAPCRAEIPIFIDLQNRFGKDGFVVVGISVDTVGPDAVRQFMNDLGMNYPVIFTSSKLEADLGGIPSIPTAFVIDRENNIIERHVGFGDPEFWEKELAPLILTAASPPILNIKSTQGKLAISWPAGPGAFILESTRDFGQRDWITRSEPARIDNSQINVILPAGDNREFFRLRKP